MDVEPPKPWRRWKLLLLWHFPLDARRKIKRFIKLGDEYLATGESELATYCYYLSKKLATEAGTIHLLKKIDQKL